MKEREADDGIHIEYLKDSRTDEITEMHEVHYCNGVRHGYYRIFIPANEGCVDDFTKFHSIGRYANGKKVGTSWKWMEGNCYFVDLSEENEEHGLHDGFYLYPKLSSGIYGTYLLFYNLATINKFKVRKHRIFS